MFINLPLAFDSDLITPTDLSLIPEELANHLAGYMAAIAIDEAAQRVFQALGEGN